MVKQAKKKAEGRDQGKQQTDKKNLTSNTKDMNSCRSNLCMSLKHWKMAPAKYHLLEPDLHVGIARQK